MSTYTDIFARFSDEVAAQTLARHIESLGFPCDLVEVSDPVSPIPLGFGVRVSRASIAELKEALKLTPVAQYADAFSPQVVAGRLARENIPCYVGCRPVGPTQWQLGYGGPPIDDTGKLGQGSLAVSESYVGAAQRVLQEQISEEDLANLALSYNFDPRDPP